MKPMFATSGLPKFYWPQALHEYMYCETWNTTPRANRTDKRSPFELLTGQGVDYSRQHPFGCLAIVTIPIANRNTGRKVDRSKSVV